MLLGESVAAISNSVDRSLGVRRWILMALSRVRMAEGPEESEEDNS